MQWSTWGAQLLSAQLAHQELFYLSPHHGLRDQLTPTPAVMRGGVPMMFPQFATRGPGPKHGLLRERIWSMVEQVHGQSYCIDVPPEPSNQWMGHARVSVSARRGSLALSPQMSAADALTMTFSVQNTGSTPFEFTGGLHPYWLLKDARTLRIEGLDAVPFEDRYGNTSATLSQPFLQGQAFERLYLQAPDIVLCDGDRRLRLRAEGFDNWMIWNPGIELAKSLSDLPDDDWRRFVCVEPVVAANPVTLEPGAAWSGLLVIQFTN